MEFIKEIGIVKFNKEIDLIMHYILTDRNRNFIYTYMETLNLNCRIG